MFPNPQDALPIPPRPNLKQYRKLAEDLVKACRTEGQDGLRKWATDWIGNLVRLSNLGITSRLPVDERRWIEEITKFASHELLAGKRKCALADAQFVIARSHGFMSWKWLVKHIEELALDNSPVAQFEAAVNAIVSGSVEKLKRLLRDNPELVRARSEREHGASLLHYTSANGVEGYRQKTPKNIIEIAGLLLRSGAEVDAEANVYGGGCTTLGLVATSIHPQEAGVQEELLQLLLDRGAQIEHPNLAGNEVSAVAACLANGQPGAAAFLAARGAKLDLPGAAGIGRDDVVKSLLNEDQSADLRDDAGTGATPLHWAAGGGHVGIVKLLLDRGAPLEEINAWGGTVLEHAGWGFEHGAFETNFTPVFETLLAAGANIRGNWLAWIDQVQSRSVDEKNRIAEVFRRYGATA